MIVKIQMPLRTDDPDPKALIYNQDRSLNMMIPVRFPGLKELMGYRFKVYFDVTVTDTEIIFNKEVSKQDW